MNLRLFSIILSVLLFVATDTKAIAYTPTTVPDPKQHCANCFVSNPDNILSANAVQTLNQQLATLQQKNGVEIAVVVLHAIEGNDEYRFAYELFNNWHIGNANNTGVLVLFVENIRAVKIETGVGVEGLLPDAFCDKVLNEVMFPHFKRGDYDKGFVTGIEIIKNRLTTDEAMEELLLATASPRVEAGNIVSLYLIIGLVIFILLTWSIYDKFNHLYGANNVKFAQLTSLETVTKIFAILFPIPILGLAWWLHRKRKKIRKTPITCAECGQTMHLLSEKEEDLFLQSGQIAEETLKSVDYDVWLCPSGHTSILPYHAQITKFTTCPKCGYKTYALQQDVVRLQPTIAQSGKGEKIFQCQHCQYEKSEFYAIPRLANTTAVFVGGKGGGSSFGGGSWGGGFSGGGGAGGRF